MAQLSTWAVVEAVGGAGGDVAWGAVGCYEADVGILGCPGFGSLLMDFGLASAVTFFAGVALFVSWCSPQSRGSANKRDNQKITEQLAFQDS